MSTSSHTRILLITMVLSAITAINASAQRDNHLMEKGVTSAVNSDADHQSVEKVLKKNAPQSRKDNGLPRFAIVGKDNLFYLGIGGQFLGEGMFTWGADMPSPVSFIPSSMTPSTPGNGGDTQFAWQSSSIYLNFVAMPGNKDQVGIFFKGDFTGNDDSFACYHFYARYRGLIAGYTTGAFTDAAAMPMTIDYEGPNGYPYTTLFTAYWHQDFARNFSGAVGIDAPTASMTAGGSTATVNQRIPAVPLYLQYAWNHGSAHVRLSGILRPMQYRDLDRGCNKTLFGSGIQLSGITPVTGGVSANFNAAYGSGIGSYLQDDNGLGLDAVATKEPGKMSAVKNLGVTAGLSFALSSKVSTNITYSHLSNWLPDDADISDDQYRYGDYVAANIMWNINKFVSAGVEYDYGHSKDFSGQSLHANRLQCQMAVTF